MNVRKSLIFLLASGVAAGTLLFATPVHASILYPEPIVKQPFTSYPMPYNPTVPLGMLR